MGIEITKELAGVEDLELGFETVQQPRGIIHRFNASFLPYSSTESVYDALNNRLTATESDAKYAVIEGDELQTFLVANGSLTYEAVNVGQLELKADIAVVDTKADLVDVLTLANNTPFTPTADYNPSTKKYVDDKFFGYFTGAYNGTFITGDAKTVTVRDGVIIGVV